MQPDMTKYALLKISGKNKIRFKMSKQRCYECLTIDINRSGLPARMFLPRSVRYQLKAKKTDEYGQILTNMSTLNIAGSSNIQKYT